MCLGDIGVVSVSYLLRVCVSVTISSSRGICVCVHASRVAWVSVSMWEGCGGALGVGCAHTAGWVHLFSPSAGRPWT